MQEWVNPASGAADGLLIHKATSTETKQLRLDLPKLFQSEPMEMHEATPKVNSVRNN